MPPRIPKLTHHKASGQGVVRLGGTDFYCGPFGESSTQAEYDRLIAEWLANNRQPIRPVISENFPAGLSVGEAILRFWRHAERHYRHPDGTPTSELGCYRLALKPLRHLYAALPVTEFSPLKFKSVRQAMISAGLCRSLINQHCGRIRRMFKWLVAEELCPASVMEALRAVTGLQWGRSEARETEPVKPVDPEHIEAVLRHLRPQVAAMVRIQLLTACRPGEVCSMRPIDLDRSGEVWVYSPNRHKLSWRGKPRKIFLGPQSQAMLGPFLEGRDPESFVFSPRESREAFQAERAAKRRTKRQPSQIRRKKKANPKRRLREYYSAHAYSRAVARTCEKASVPIWRPNRLRHTAATIIRKEYGLEAAQVILGHSRADVTQIYAERDIQKAEAIIKAIG